MKTPAKRSLMRQVYLEQELEALLAQIALALEKAGAEIDRYYDAVEGRER